MNRGDHIDPTGEHGLRLIGWAWPRRVVGMGVIDPHHIQFFLLRRQLSLGKLLGREAEIETAATFLTQDVL